MQFNCVLSQYHIHSHLQIFILAILQHLQSCDSASSSFLRLCYILIPAILRLLHFWDCAIFHSCDSAIYSFLWFCDIYIPEIVRHLSCDLSNLHSCDLATSSILRFCEFFISEIVLYLNSCDSATSSFLRLCYISFLRFCDIIISVILRYLHSWDCSTSFLQLCDIFILVTLRHIHSAIGQYLRSCDIYIPAIQRYLHSWDCATSLFLWLCDTFILWFFNIFVPVTSQFLRHLYSGLRLRHLHSCSSATSLFTQLLHSWDCDIFIPVTSLLRTATVTSSLLRLCDIFTSAMLWHFHMCDCDIFSSVTLCHLYFYDSVTFSSFCIETFLNLRYLWLTLWLYVSIIFHAAVRATFKNCVSCECDCSIIYSPVERLPNQSIDAHHIFQIAIIKDWG